MVQKTSLLLSAAVSVLFVGCATVPDKSELTRMERDDVRSAVVGNTFTFLADYGRWAEYVESLESGYAKAWGGWGSQSVTAEYTIAADGEWCSVYAGEPDWAIPEYEYCSVMYTDAEGNFYMETLTNPDKPASEGQIRQVEIRSDDEYELASM